jgi:hypothetical protein
MQEALTGRSVDAAVYINLLDLYRMESADKTVCLGSVPGALLFPFLPRFIPIL